MTAIRAIHRLEPRSDAPGFTHVSVVETGQGFEVEPGETLLAAALRAGLRLPADCKSGFCGACRLRVVEGEVFHPEDLPGLAEEERLCGFALGCQARALTRLSIEAELLPFDLPEPAICEAVVLRRETPAPGLTRLWLSLPGAAAFRPGQYVNILMEDGAKRPFSIATLPGRNEIELQIRGIPGGRFTEGRLPALVPGDRLSLEMPQGIFHLHPEDFRPVVFAATGTGIAPVAALLAELAQEPEEAPPVSVYWGMREEGELYLLEELAALGAGIDGFELVPVLSRPGPDWQGRHGHVQQAVLEDLPDLAEHALYLCGNANMVAQARRLFLAAGASANHIYADSFTFAHGG
ncbi:2Fe-2S iron-sulfur cluster-binding protein [Poseidonocella sp. HB161398]|uniref:2Fe-2S iron-sulfur cluster-binding protein n=1 Tax=Poseidonocella sp. HB161398 TaxID=2320855 RepID=UPI00110948AA|nr:2Fe-2S iron-sulfur cluster-binding protein [Poseidonocella sp. HB161398]